VVETVEQVAEQPVGGLELEQVALVGLLDEKPHAVARAAVEPSDLLVRLDPVRAPRGQVLERHVRHQDVDQVQPWPRPAPDAGDEILPPARPAAAQVRVQAAVAVLLALAPRAGGHGDRLVGSGALVEVPPGLGHGGEVPLEVVRQHEVRVHEAEVVPERLHPLAEAAAVLVRAEARRADRGGLLANVQLVVAAEQGEDVLRVVGGDRQVVLPREPPVQDGGHRVGRVLVDRGGVAVPGRVAGEAGEVRVQPLVDPPVGVHQRVHG
jgi:hypothetical protein